MFCKNLRRFFEEINSIKLRLTKIPFFFPVMVQWISLLAWYTQTYQVIDESHKISYNKIRFIFMNPLLPIQQVRPFLLS